MSGKTRNHCHTTGACAAAAAKGAALMLRDQVPVREVDLTLPCGETAHYRLEGAVLHDDGASCHVEAEQDREVPKAQVHVQIKVANAARPRTVLSCGPGVGKVARPGLAADGEWAINPLSRRMILEVLKEVFALRCLPWALTVTLSIPNGEELAEKKRQQRAGIVGGLEVRHGH